MMRRYLHSWRGDIASGRWRSFGNRTFFFFLSRCVCWFSLVPASSSSPNERWRKVDLFCFVRNVVTTSILCWLCNDLVLEYYALRTLSFIQWQVRLSYSRPFYHATLFIVSVSTTEDIYRWDVYIMRVCLFIRIDYSLSYQWFSFGGNWKVDALIFSGIKTS